MDLISNTPPGRANRKAKAFTAAIQRLRAQGHTFEAIRVILEEAGVQVSRATVRREAMKGARASRPAYPAPHSALQQRLRPPAQATHWAPSAAPEIDARSESSPAVRPYVGDPRRGKAIAEAFMQGQITNPLMRERMLYEDRSD